MNTKKELHFNLNNFLLSLSLGFDGVQKNLFGTSLHHAKRVAYLSVLFAKEFNYREKALFDLCAYALMHHMALRHHGEKTQAYCKESEALSKMFPFLEPCEGVLLYQCEHADGSGVFGLKEKDIPLFSQFIAFASRLDREFDLSCVDFEKQQNITRFLKEQENRLFSKELVECFLLFSQKPSFWLDLSDETALVMMLFSNLQDFSCILRFEALNHIGAEVLRLCEPETNLSQLAKRACLHYGFEHKEMQTFLLAAHFCKLGKLLLDKQTLKAKELTQEQLLHLKAYPYYNQKLLANIIGFQEITKLASSVQERLDAKGYPYCLGAHEQSFNQRLLVCLVAYDALCSKRVYRKAYSHQEAISLLQSMPVEQSIVQELAFLDEPVFEANIQEIPN